MITMIGGIIQIHYHSMQKKKKKKLYYDYTTVRSEPIQYPRSVEVPSDLLKTLQSLENNL